MVDDADAERGGKPERYREAKGVEERQDAEQAIVLVEHEHLANLLDVGGDVVVREHYSLGFTRAAAGKNNRGEIVESFRFAAAQEFFERGAGEKP